MVDDLNATASQQTVVNGLLSLPWALKIGTFHRFSLPTSRLVTFNFITLSLLQDVDFFPIHDQSWD